MSVCFTSHQSQIEQLTFDLATLNVIADGLRTPAVDLAAGGESSAENLLYGALETLRHRLVAHLTCDLDDLVKWDGLGVLDVLLLLAVSWWLLQRLDD